MLELDSLRDVIKRIGWMADLGCEKLGGEPVVKGCAEEWLLPPSYRHIDATA